MRWRKGLAQHLGLSFLAHCLAAATRCDEALRAKPKCLRQTARQPYQPGAE